MYKLIKIAVMSLAACGIGSCETQRPAPGPISTAAPSHETALGFTPWPADLTTAGVDRTYAFIHNNANLVAHHFDGGIPWDEALAGTRLPKHLREDWATRKSNTPARFQSFIAITPLNFERTGLASAWASDGDNKPLSKNWATKSLNDPEVKRAYLNYAEQVIAYFQPDYLAIGIEANIMVSKSPENWSAYLELNRYVYRGLKAKHPDLPVFATIQYEHLRGIEDDSKRNARQQIPAVQDLMQHSDLTALSTYRYGNYHPNPMGPDYFEIAEAFNKPIAIAEFGAMSAPVKIFGTKLPADELGQAEFLSGILDYAARNQSPFVVNWVAVDFNPMLKKLPAPMDEIAKAWVHTGLQNAKGRNKIALGVWTSYLEAYHSD